MSELALAFTPLLPWPAFALLIVAALGLLGFALYAEAEGRGMAGAGPRAAARARSPTRRWFASSARRKRASSPSCSTAAKARPSAPA